MQRSSPNTTIFEDTISTAGNIVTTSSGGTHMCDGTNGGAHTTPGGTITSAIDDAVSTWDGTWDKRTRDYFITSIAGYSQTVDKFWGGLVGYKAIDKMGCQFKVAAGDQVLLAFDLWSAKAVLEASADKQSLQRGGEVAFTVVNGMDKMPIEGATVAANAGPRGTTDSNGKDTLTFKDIGVYKYKARKGGTIRSNEVAVTVTPAAPALTMTTTTAGMGGQTVYLYDSGFGGCNQ